MATAFISTTIPYVDARPHLGHAMEYVHADASARYLSTRYDVYFLSGSDDNSLKNVLAADKLGITPEELVRTSVVHFQELLASLGVEVSRFIKTSTDLDHLDGARALWQKLAANGDLYTKDYSGLYCVGCEAFYTPDDLTPQGLCPEHLTEPELVQETNWFFRLSKYQDQVEEVIANDQVLIRPTSRKNEVLSFVRQGLEDISVSRSVARSRGWGIRVPGDESQVMYVWIDALTNYINALGWNERAPSYVKYWEKAEERIHVLGKGVIRFHAVYWLAMLISAGLPLPTQELVHGYITLSGSKISKSLGNSVDAIELVNEYGRDAVRYYLLAEFTPYGDGDFSIERLIHRYNHDLANGIGNLVSRFASMVHRYAEGTVPTGDEFDDDRRLLIAVRETHALFEDAMSRFDHKEALEAVSALVRQANAFVDTRAPWHLSKQESDESARLLSSTLHTLAHVIYALSVLLRVHLPGAAVRIGSTLPGVPARGWVSDDDERRALLSGEPVHKPEPIFPRL